METTVCSCGLHILYGCITNVQVNEHNTCAQVSHNAISHAPAIRPQTVPLYAHGTWIEWSEARVREKEYVSFYLSRERETERAETTIENMYTFSLQLRPLSSPVGTRVLVDRKAVGEGLARCNTTLGDSMHTIHPTVVFHVQPVPVNACHCGVHRVLGSMGGSKRGTVGGSCRGAELKV